MTNQELTGENPNKIGDLPPGFDDARATMNAAQRWGDPSALAEQLSLFELSDTGVARRFIARHGSRYLYVPGLGWFAWDGRRWKQDVDDQLIRLDMQATAAAILDERHFLDDPKIADQRVKFAGRASEAHKVRGAVEMAAPRLNAPLESFDAHPTLLACKNGVIDLATGALRPHDPALRLTKLTHIDYIPHAPCPTWLDFLSSITGQSLDQEPDPDDDLIGGLQRWIGYTLTGETSEHKMGILYGSGANGKTTLLEVIAALAGDYAAQMPIESLMLRDRGGGIPSDIARLRGARFVETVEATAGARLNEGLVKSITGGDKIIARFLHKDWFEFTPEFKLWMGTNYRPYISGTDLGIWRRLCLIDFPFTFVDGPNILPGQRLKDRGLKKKLMGELPGILAWGVRGAVDWHQVGLKIPQRWIAATDAYRAESDPFGDFVAECTEAAPAFSASARTLKTAYDRWCAETAGGNPMSATAFGRALALRGFVKVHTEFGNHWRGIQLNAAWLSKVSQPPPHGD